MEYENYNWNTITKYTGIIIMIIALIFVMLFFKTHGSLEATIAFGFISLGIALFSLGIAGESDEKMNAIANVKFMETADAFEQMKNMILRQRNRYSGTRSYLIWKCRKQLEQAEKLKKWVDSKPQEDLAKYYMYLVEKLNPETLNKTEKTDIGYIHKSIKKLDVDDKYKVYPERLLQKPKKDS